MSRARSSLALWLAFGAIAVGGTFTIFWLRPQPLTDADRAALVTSADIGFPAKQGTETFDKRRVLGGATEVHYKARELGQHGRATLEEIRFDYLSRTGAITGFAGIRMGARGGFAVAAGNRETMVPKEIRFAWADDTFWADYLVGDTPAGAFVLVRNGSTVHFLSLNGIVPDAARLEAVLRARWSAPN